MVKGSKGGFYPGVRIENVSFPLTISSVQAACCICLSYGEVPSVIHVEEDSDPQLPFWVEEFGCTLEIGSIPETVNLTDYRDSSPDNKKNRLKELLATAITPNSEFPVSAILETKTSVFEGVNVEVSDWAKGLCAERVALAKALTSGDREFIDISVHTLKGEFSSPCGACRQVLYEHLPLSKVELFHADDTYSEHFIIDLLPFSFTSKDLRK